MSAHLIQLARDIVADQFLAQEAMRDPITPEGNTPEGWQSHVTRYAKFLRGGAYDDDLAIVSAIAALKSVDPMMALLAVVDATRAYLPPDGISGSECISRITEATDNLSITPIILAAEKELAA